MTPYPAAPAPPNADRPETGSARQRETDVTDTTLTIPEPIATTAVPSLCLVSADTTTAAERVAAHPAASGNGTTLRRIAGSTGAVRAASCAGASLGAPRAVEGTPRPVAFLLPGLGDHHSGMARGLYDIFPVVAEVIEHCVDVLRQECDLDVRPVLLDRLDGSARGLDLRALAGRSSAPGSVVPDSLAQPALFVLEYALAAQWAAWNVRPSAMVGYSLGEYVAATLSGVLALEDALRLVGARARALEAAPPGAMLAVGAAEDVVEELLREGVWVSARTSPGLTVVAGEPKAVAELAQRCRARSLTTRPVASDHAFHTPLMEPIAARLTDIARGITTRVPGTPFVSNVTGTWMTDEDALDPGYWARHLCSAVRFGDGVVALPDHVLLEVGPGQSLSSIAVEVRGGDSSDVVASMRHAFQADDDATAATRALGRLWTANADVDWSGVVVNEFDDAQVSSDAPPAAPSSAGAGGTVTATIAAIWQRLLQREETVPTSMSFFDLGGNSLLASRLALRLKRELGTSLTLRQVYVHSTVEALAALVRGEESTVVAGSSGPVDNFLMLPNGLVVSQQNEAETLHFYDDIFEHRGYVRHGVHVREGATVLDVGGNIGLFTLFVHHEAPGVRVHTFEPAPPMVEHLRRNVERHGVNVTIHPVGVSDVEGTAPLVFYPRSSGMSTLAPDLDEEKRNLRAIIANQEAAGNSSGAELAEVTDELLDVRFSGQVHEVRLRRLSDVIREEGITVVDLLKVDVQKAEAAVLASIDEEHWPMIRQLVAEVHDGQDGRVAQVRADLESRGFHVTVVQDELYRGTDIHNLYAIRENQ